MLRRAFAFIATAMLSTAALALPVIGETAPDFTAVDVLSGKKITLSELKGKLVVLETSNFQCPFVKKHYSVGAMQQLQASAAKNGVVWISFNASAPGKEGYLENAKEAQDVIAANNAQPAYYILDPEGKIGHLYEAKVTPHMYVIDTAGKLAYMGAIDNKPTADTADIAIATNYVTQALKSLKEGTPIKTPSTQPYGCFVKY